MVAMPPDIFKDALILLGATGIVIPLFQRQRISPIIGFILVGIAVGPSGLGALVHYWPPLAAVTIEDPAAIGPLAELGVVFLMFMIGLELSWERLNTTRRMVFGLGFVQVAISAIVIAGGLMAFGFDRSASVAIGLALAMSSTAVIVQVLVGENRLASMAGRVSFAVLLFQDLAVVPILFALNFAGVGAGENGISTEPNMLIIAEAVLSALAAVTIVLVIGRWALRPLFHSVARSGSPESFMAISLLVVLSTGLITAYAGLSMALGALIAGLLLAETEYRRQIEVTIEPFKGLFLGIFLIAIGMSLDLAHFISAPLIILSLCIGLVLIKLVLIICSGRFFGLSWNVGLQSGLLLAPGGEFGFVILEVARDHGLIDGAQAQTALLVATITLAMIPLLSRAGRRLSPYVARTRTHDLTITTPVSDPATPRVIIAGFGRVGQMVADMLEAHQVPYIALDSDADRVAAERRRGRPVYFGDMTRPDILAKLELEQARALVITVDDNRVVDQLVASARAMREDLIITARARDARHAAALYRLGASDAVPETVEASLQLSEAVLVDIGTPMGLVIASIHEKRAQIQEQTKAMAPQARQRTRTRRRRASGTNP